MGGNDGGITLYAQGRIALLRTQLRRTGGLHGDVDQRRSRAGRHFLSVEFKPTGKADPKNGKGTPGDVTLLVDGKKVGEGTFPVTTPIRLAQGGHMLVGADNGSSVTPAYDPPFAYTGTIHRVIVDVSGEHVEDYEAQMKIALAKQ